MSRTLSLEEMPSDTRRVFEELLTSDTPILLLRNGQVLGGMMGYPTADAFPPLSEEEKADLMATIAQGEADYAAGRYCTMEEFLEKYADRLCEDEDEE